MKKFVGIDDTNCDDESRLEIRYNALRENILDAIKEERQRLHTFDLSNNKLLFKMFDFDAKKLIGKLKKDKIINDSVEFEIIHCDTDEELLEFMDELSNYSPETAKLVDEIVDEAMKEAFQELFEIINKEK